MVDKKQNKSQQSSIDDFVTDSNVNHYIVYTDGSCIPNPGPGGWGAVIIENGLPRELSGKEAATTNNRMEVTAVIEALKEVAKESEIVVYSDSTYVINTMMKNWKRNKNKDLWELLDREMAGRKVRWEWVKGHSGDPLNERADRLAHGAATSISNPKKKDINEDMGLSEDLKRKKVGLTHIDSVGAGVYGVLYYHLLK